MFIRDEMRGDERAIRAVTKAAFLNAPYSNQLEADIIESLRQASMLTLSLVAEDAGKIVGHVAFSPVLINGTDLGWHGLGPVSVLPERQGEGIGSALIREGLLRLQQLGSQGCVLLGEPAYYARFGFSSDKRLFLKGVPAEYFQALPCGRDIPSGEVTYHSAFSS